MPDFPDFSLFCEKSVFFFESFNSFLHILSLTHQSWKGMVNMLKKYFVRANTAEGLVNLAETNLSGLCGVYSVSGSSKTAKTQLMKAIAGHFDMLGKTVECIISPFDITMYDAVIIREFGVAVADSDIYSVGTPIDTDEFLSFNRLEADLSYIDELNQKSKSALSDMYSQYALAKKIHDEWENIYVSNTDYSLLSSYTDGVISRFTEIPFVKNNAPRCERFFGASTQDGSVNYIDSVTEGLKMRYFIKGRPGTGKSTFLKRLDSAMRLKGYETQVYYCSFDKNSLDMVLVPELSFCVFDSTSPHELFPQRDGDCVLDFYTESGLSGTDEKFSKQLELIKNKYSFRISEALISLRLCTTLQKEREFYLSRITNDYALTTLADKIIRKISDI